MNICIIPARGGSKRIPRKNIKVFEGLPIIAYSIKTAIESKCFDRVIVSTDDDEIANVAAKYGADIPFKRPRELSNDYIGVEKVVDHAIQQIEKDGTVCKYVCTLFATAPLLKKKYLIQGYDELIKSDAVNSFSATSMPFPIQRSFKITKGGRCQMFNPEHYMSRSQDLDNAFHDAGQFYWRNRSKISNEIMFDKDSIPIILPRHYVQDIDTIEDWRIAEYMFKIMNAKF